MNLFQSPSCMQAVETNQQKVSTVESSRPIIWLDKNVRQFIPEALSETTYRLHGTQLDWVQTNSKIRQYKGI